MFTTLMSTSGSGASAQVFESAAANAETTQIFTALPVVQQLPVEADPADVVANDELVATVDSPVDADSLRELVAEVSAPADLDTQLHCLAGAIYFESKGESLDGQLAVAKVVMERAASSRFPNSYCGVVYQRSQFSFVRNGSMPNIRTSSAAWSNAKKIAKIAHEDMWDSKVEGALFFHASRVSPGWRLKRIAQIDNHVFYR